MIDVREARRLGLRTAVVVAVGWDSLIVGFIALTAIQRVVQGGDPLDMDWVLAGELLLALTVVSVLAAAPGGWLLGPSAIASAGRSKSAVVVAMGLGAVLVGDVILSIGLALGPTQGDNAFGLPGVATLASLIVIGGVMVGPFVFAFVTLPSAAIWSVMVERAWRRRNEPA